MAETEFILPGCKDKMLSLYYRAKAPLIYRFTLRHFGEIFPAARNGGCGGVLRKAAFEYVRRPGKLLRPVITAAILESAGKKIGDYSGVLSAVEYMEAATVMFDDIIDSSDTRRGGKAAHLVHGEKNALFAFLALYHAAGAVFLDIPCGDARKSRFLDSLAREIFAYVHGQCRELKWSREKRVVSPRDYFGMTFERIRFLSFAGPFRTGAVLAGFSGARADNLVNAGVWSGMAYHLRGDYLNIFPASPGWGKPLADDITAGRMTYLISRAFRTAEKEDREFLARVFGNRNASEVEIKNAINIIAKGRAPSDNFERIKTFAGKGLSFLEKASLPGKWKRLLSAMIKYMAYERTK